MAWLVEESGETQIGQNRPVLYFESDFQIVGNPDLGAPAGFCEPGALDGLNVVKPLDELGDRAVLRIGFGMLDLYLDELRVVTLLLGAAGSDLSSPVTIITDQFEFDSVDGFEELRGKPIKSIEIRRSDDLVGFSVNESRAQLDYVPGPTGFGFAKAIEQSVVGAGIFEKRHDKFRFRGPRILLAQVVIVVAGAFAAQAFEAPFPIVAAASLLLAMATSTFITNQHFSINQPSVAPNKINSEWRANIYLDPSSGSFRQGLGEFGLAVFASLISSLIVAVIAFVIGRYF